MADALFVYDAAGRILRLNTFAREIMEPEAAAWQSSTVEARAYRMTFRDEHDQAVPLESLPAQRMLRGEVLTGAQAVGLSVTNAAGRTWLLNMSGTPLCATDGAITGAVLVARYVTERRRLEREIAERAAELQAVFEAATDGIVLLDTDGRLVQTNRAFRAAFGFEAHLESMRLPLAQRLAALEIRNGEGLPLALEAWPALRLLEGEILTGVDTRIKNLEGRELVLSVSGAPLRDAHGAISGAWRCFATSPHATGWSSAPALP